MQLTMMILFRGLQLACERQGNIEVRTQTAARALIKEDGRVVGLETVSTHSLPWALMLLREIAEAGLFSKGEVGRSMGK